MSPNDPPQLDLPGDDPWQPCQDEISKMVRQLGKVDRRRRFRQLASTATLGLVLGAVGTVAAGLVFYQEPDFGGIGCAECLSHAAEYRDHLAGDRPMADLQLASSIKSHLDQCRCCGAKFRLAYPEVSLASIGMENPPWRSGRFVFAVATVAIAY